METAADISTTITEALAPPSTGVRARRPVAAVTWRAFLGSRVLVLLAGATAVLLLGTVQANVASFDPLRVSVSLGRVGNLLAAPFVRWDSIWYLQIAAHGYRTGQDTAFSPLLPLMMRTLSWVTGSVLISGLLISLTSCLVALEIIRRLTVLELGAVTAQRTVELIAFGPLTVFLSAIYTDGLFLALSAGTVYAARRGRWRLAAVLGAMASVSRPAGAVVIAPVLVLFFYGPREDAPPRPVSAWWKPRYPLSPSVLWSAAIPLPAAAFGAYLATRGFGASGAIAAQQQYMHHSITFPWVGAWNGLREAWHQLMLVASGAHLTGDGSQAVIQAVALLTVGVALAGTFSRLPSAYGIYVALAMLVHLCSPSAGDPLKGFDRYASLRFPLFMWAASWSIDRGLSRTLVLASALFMVIFTSQFATWHIVSSLIL